MKTKNINNKKATTTTRKREIFETKNLELTLNLKLLNAAACCSSCLRSYRAAPVNTTAATATTTTTTTKARKRDEHHTHAHTQKNEFMLKERMCLFINNT